MPRLPFIAPQGVPFLLFAALLVMVGHISGHPVLIGLGWSSLLFLIWLFREPHRKRLTPLKRYSLVSPLHGEVIAVAETELPCAEGRSLHLRLRMNWGDVMALYSPGTGKINGHKLSPSCANSLGAEPYGSFVVDSDEGDAVLMILSKRHPWSYFACHPHLGERVGIGQRCGYCYFACQVDLFLPPRARVFIKPGDRVIGGETLLADILPQAIKSN